MVEAPPPGMPQGAEGRARFAADLAACRAMLRQGSRTFLAASRLLPPEVSASATVLYAFCRQADDMVDIGGGRFEALGELRSRLALAYAGRPRPSAVDRALAVVVHRHALPAELLEALLEGIEWDAQGRSYAGLPELEAYAARVAGTVGAMMAVVMGARAPEVVARACDLGVAMQLSNIARDIGEDARAGRLYLPRAWMAEEGLECEAFLARPVFSPALGRVVDRLLARAEELYARSAAGIDRLPAACRPGIHAARLLYREIGREVSRRGLDSVSGRAVVRPSRKAALLAQSVASAARAGSGEKASPLSAARFLVDAVASTPAPQPAGAPRRMPWWRPVEQVLWTLDLFERLERREMARFGS